MKTKIWLTSAILIISYSLAEAQYYYGAPPPPPPQRRHAPREQKQEEEESNYTPKGFVAINTGLSYVTGNFGNNVGTNYGNYALNGTTENVSAGIPINHTNFGISLSLGYFINPFDINSYVTNINYADPNAANEQYVYGDQYYYVERGFMAGGFYTYPYKRFSFDGKLQIGILSCLFPEVDYGYYVGNATYPYSYSIAPSKSESFAIDVGAGVRFSLRRNACLMLSADYLNSTARYNTLVQLVDPSGNTFQHSLTGTIPISLFSINIGIGMEFGR